MNFDFKKYTILNQIILNDGKKIILFASCYDDDQQNHEILGKEVFLFDNNNNIIWQIDSPQGERHIFNSTTNKYESEPYDWYFSSIYQNDKKILAEKFNGDVFEVDLETGKASYIYWTK